jgi:hypothetical protein
LCAQDGADYLFQYDLNGLPVSIRVRLYSRDLAPHLITVEVRGDPR